MYQISWFVFVLKMSELVGDRCFVLSKWSIKTTANCRHSLELSGKCTIVFESLCFNFFVKVKWVLFYCLKNYSIKIVCTNLKQSKCMCIYQKSMKIYALDLEIIRLDKSYFCWQWKVSFINKKPLYKFSN